MALLDGFARAGQLFVAIVAALIITVVMVAGAAGIASLGLWLLTTRAAAHEWYPSECCSGQDCIPVPFEAIRLTPDGFLIVETGDLIPYGDDRLRFTPVEHEDGRGYHWCRSLVDAQTFCLFVPGGAS